MRGVTTSILSLSLLAFTGTAGAVDWSAICCDGGYEYRHPSAWEKEQQRLRDAQAAGRSGDQGKAAGGLRRSSGDVCHRWHRRLDSPSMLDLDIDAEEDPYKHGHCSLWRGPRR